MIIQCHYDDFFSCVQMALYGLENQAKFMRDYDCDREKATELLIGL